MLSRVFSGLFAFALFLVADPLLAQTDWVGKTVLAKKPQTALKATSGGGTKTVMTRFISYEVSKERGGSILIRQNSVDCWAEKKDFVTLEEAPKYYSSRIKMNAKDGYAYAYRAWAHALRGNDDLALKDVDQAIRFMPKAAAWWDNRGAIYLRKKDYDHAIKDLTQALKLDPKDAYARLTRGDAWYAKKDYDKAIDDYSAAIKLEPGFFIAWVNRAGAWLAKQEDDKAIADYDGALRIDRDHVPSLATRGSLRFKKKEYDKALEDFSLALVAQPRNEKVLCMRALVWATKRQFGKAIQDYETALAAQPEQPEVLRSFAWFLATCPDAKYRNGKRAVQLATEACKWAAGSKAPEHDALAAACAEAGRFDEAVTHQEAALADADFARTDGAFARQRLEWYRRKMAYHME